MQDFFLSIAKRLCSGTDIDVTKYEKEFDLFEAMINSGIEQDTIINHFLTAINLPYEDIMDKSLATSAIFPDRLESVVKHIRIFPFHKDDTIIVAVSEPQQMEFAEDLMKEKDYMFCFSFQFLIDSKLSETAEDTKALQPKSAGEERGVQLTEMGLSTVLGGNKTILLASGTPEIDNIISNAKQFSNSYITVGTVQHRTNLRENCEAHNPDILLVGYPIGGTNSLTEILLSLHSDFPDIRIIYLAGELAANDNIKALTLASLASAGIYDLITTNDISVPMLKDILDNPLSKKNVEYLLAKMKDTESKKKVGINIHVADDVQTDDSVLVYHNLFGVASPKGGTGKSFILENVAIAIATLGILNEQGEKPRIAIVDLDLQGFSTSKFFAALDEQDNIFEAIKEAEKVIDPLIGSPKPDVPEITQKFVNERIKQMFKPCHKYANIRLLAGTDIVYRKGEMDSLSPYILTYILETIQDDYDIILVDMNSNIENKSVYPLYNFANCVYNVIDMNWATFHNNKRFRTFLETNSLYFSAQTGYILNKAVFGEELYVSIKDIESGLGVVFDCIVPEISGARMFNLSCKSENIIQQTDEAISPIRYYLIDLANKMYPIKDFELLESEFAEHKLVNEKALIKKEELKKKDPTKKKPLEVGKILSELTSSIKKYIPNKKGTPAAEPVSEDAEIDEN